MTKRTELQETSLVGHASTDLSVDLDIQNFYAHYSRYVSICKLLSTKRSARRCRVKGDASVAGSHADFSESISVHGDEYGQVLLQGTNHSF